MPRLYKSPLIRIAVLLFVIIFASLPVLETGVIQAETNKDSSSALPPLTESALNEQLPFYSNVLHAWEAEGIQPAGDTITVRGADYSDASDPETVHIQSYKGKDRVLLWQNKRENWIEYRFQITEPGLYHLSLNYHPIMASDEDKYEVRSNAEIDVQLDGAYPFREAKAIPFPRWFKDEFPLKQNQYGDDIRPSSIQIDEWMTAYFRDAAGAYTEPLQWYLSSGTHVLRLTTRDAIAIDSLQITAPQPVPGYAQVSASYPITENADAGEWTLIQFEAEHADRKNDISIQLGFDKDPGMTPVADGVQKFNALGGSGWRDGGQKAVWKFNVEQDGLYKIAMRTMQNYEPNHAVYRTIYVDGQVPFSELLAYQFPYRSGWQSTVLQDAEGEPFYFYLTKGEHTLAMEATYAPYQALLVHVEDVIRRLNNVSQELFSISGGIVDTQRTWRMKRDYPEILDQLAEIASDLKLMEQESIRINQQRDNVATVLGTSAETIQSMLENPNDIPNRMDQLSTLRSQVGSTRAMLTGAPLKIDTFYIVPEQMDIPNMKASFWKKLVSSIKNFFYSFTRTGRLETTSTEDDVVHVWMKFGRDYVDLLQQMADQTFTPETGIKVKIDMLANTQVLVLANSANKQPDVVLGLGEGEPVNFGLRGAAADLSQFPGFEEVKSQYAPGALQPYYYDDQYFGLPETQHFQMMFYRKDILDKLGLSVPETWDDVYAMLPTLQQNHYDFFIPQGIYLALFYQYGADFYNATGTASALDTPEAYEAFQKYTDLYSIYGIPEQVSSFYQHFRDGDIPIGLSDFNTFIELSVAAPELTGWWEMAPIPGVRQEDGTIARWAGGNAGALSEGMSSSGGGADSGIGGQTSVMIFEESQVKSDAWQFVKWWLSAETQVEYGSSLESFFGTAFRWNTANIDAFVHLPWKQKELDAILEQWKWYRTLVQIPGSYFIPREMQNAWNRTVLNGQNFRSSLQEAKRNIDREIIRKGTEFGVRDEFGNIIKTLDPPIIDQPWDGVKQYVE